MIRLTKIFFFTLILSCNFVYSQTINNIDSLINVVEKEEEQKKVQTYNKIATFYRSKDPEKNILYATKALELSLKINNEKEEGYAYSNLGYAWYVKGEYSKSTEYLNLGVKIGLKLSDKKLLGACYNTLGLLQQNLGNMSVSINNFVLALQYREAIGDTNGMAASTNNLAESYRLYGIYNLALEKLKIAEALYLKKNSKLGLGGVYSNMGAIYLQTKKYKEAIIYFQKAIEIQNEVQNKRGEAIALANLAEAYRTTNQKNAALSTIKDAVTIAEELNDPIIYLNNLTTMSNIYVLVDSMDKAKTTIKLVLDSATKLDINLQVLSAKLIFADILFKTHEYKDAYKYLFQYINLKNGIFDDETIERINSNQAEIAKQKRETEIKLKEESNKRQKIILAFSLLLFAVIALFFIVQFRLKQKSHKLLEAQNKIIADKNKEIGDSIEYAKKIQGAMLPLDKYLTKIFPSAFKIYKPKDIVSGDFYWCVEHFDNCFIAATDCTGHGVPGAFMSMLGNDKLTHAVKDKNLLQPSEILTELNNSIKQTLKQNEIDSELRDGMDIALCCFDFTNNTLQYAGANRPLFHIRNGTLTEYKATKAAIGGTTSNNFVFENNIIPLQKNDTIYVFTDGITDQFGGEKGKKFSTKKLKELLISIYTKEMTDQETEIKTVLQNWTNINGTHYEQVDDILLIGIKV